MVQRLVVSDRQPEDPATGKDIANFSTGGAWFVAVDVQQAS